MIDPIFFYRIRLIVLTLAISTLYIQCGCQNPTVGDLEKHKKNQDKKIDKVKKLELGIKLAIAKKDTKTLKELIERADELPPSTDNNPYLILATRNNYLEGVQLLLQKLKIKDINAQDEKGYTALHWAAEKGSTAIVNTLLNTKKANIHIQSKIYKDTPLLIAAREQYPEIVKSLTAFDASAEHINARDSWGNSALILVLSDDSKHGNKLAIVNILLEKKADLTIKGAEGQTALELATEQANRRLYKLDPAKEMQKIKKALENASKA